MTDIDKEEIKTLTFDIFGTVLDLSGSLIPPTQEFLSSRNSNLSAQILWTSIGLITSASVCSK